jgi:hypothetical protein
MKVVRATFRAGQFIPVHAPDVHVALYILAGEGEGRPTPPSPTWPGCGAGRCRCP